MVRYKIEFSYNGRDFSGFQVQPGKRTVQGEMEKVLEKLLKTPVRLYASGRTDAGVSALMQVGHFDFEELGNLKTFASSMNAFLPEDISVTSISEAEEGFDSRFSAKKKTYRYYFYVSKSCHALYRNFAVRVNDYADISLMEDAAKMFVGTFDFKSFVAKKSGKTDFVRTIYSAQIIPIHDCLYAFEVTGNGFLYNMVRIMFGTILSAGYKKITPTDITSIISGKNRALAGKTMPAFPLLLVSVSYEK